MIVLVSKNNTEEKNDSSFLKVTLTIVKTGWKYPLITLRKNLL